MHVTALDPSEGARLIPELIGRLCAGRGLSTLWVSFDYDASDASSLGPTDRDNLSKLVLPAHQLLDPESLRLGLEKALATYERIVVDSTALAEPEARLALAPLVESTLLVVDGETVPRSHYRSFVDSYRNLMPGDRPLLLALATGDLALSRDAGENRPVGSGKSRFAWRARSGCRRGSSGRRGAG